MGTNHQENQSQTKFDPSGHDPTLLDKINLLNLHPRVWNALSALVLSVTVACSLPGTTSAETPNEPGNNFAPGPQPTLEAIDPNIPEEVTSTSSPHTTPTTRTTIDRPENGSGTLPNNPEIKQQRRLSEAERYLAASASGYNGLLSSEVNAIVVDEFITENNNAKVIVVNVGSEPLPHSLETINSYWNTAEKIASMGQNYSPELALGNGAKVEVPFQILPANKAPGANGEQQTHFIFFTDSQDQMRKLAGSRHLGEGIAFSANNYLKGVSVSLLSPTSLYEHGVPYNNISLMIEAMNANSGALIVDHNLVGRILSGEQDIDNLITPEELAQIQRNGGDVLVLLEAVLRDLYAVSVSRASAIASNADYNYYSVQFEEFGDSESYPKLMIRLLKITQPIYEILKS